MTWQSQIIDLLTASLIRPIVLAAAAWLVLRIYKVRHPASLHAVWTAVLIGVMVLPIVSVITPQWKLPLLPKRLEPVVQTRVKQSGVFTDTEYSDVRPNADAIAPSHATKFVWPATQTPIVWCYFAGVLAMVIFRVTGWALLWRVLLKSRVLRARLRESSEVITPVTVGLLRPSVILPTGWRNWNANTKRAVLAHEFAHIRRRDTLTSSLTRLAKCIYWFHPLAWWISRQVSELAELSCDAAALERNGDPGGYSRILLGFAETVNVAGYRAALPGLAIASRSGMNHRIDQVFELAGGNLRKLSRPGTVLAFMGVPVMCIAAVVGLTAPASRVFHQAASTIAPSQPTVVAQLQQPAIRAQSLSTSEPAPKFDVASIRPCVPGEGGGGGRGNAGGAASSGGPTATPGRLVLNCVDVNRLINMAYVQFADHSAPDDPITITIIGGPAWTKAALGPNFSSSDRYTIEATTEGNPSQEMMRGSMLRSLLEDRFKVKVHRETKEVPAYALTIARGGPKLQPFDGQCFNFDFTKFPPQGPQPGQRPCEHGAGRKGPNIAVALQADSLRSFSGVLGNLVGRFVVDKTGILGLFDFEFESAPDDNLPQSLRGDSPANDFCEIRPTLPVCKTNAGSASDPAGPSIFTVLEKQFGLRLEPTTGPKEFLVIDHVERPSEN